MGFANSGQDYQMEVEEMFKDCKEFVKVFQDDICIMSDNQEDHYKHIKEVLSRLHDAFIIPNLKKCEWFKNEIKFCGFIISKNLIKPDKERVQAIADMSPPKTIHGMQKFLGMINYFNSFIPNYSIITAELYESLKGLKNRVIA
uniref:Reverse transcriptase domain-containing protein n=1 Tax=Arcella intermedia TaxID=1963864 RepID=A0A6B2LQ56_9EUKA